MPVSLRQGDKVHRYRVCRDEFIQGGQARGHYVEDDQGRPRFLKMFMEPTARDPGAASFLARQQALGERLRRIPLFVLQDLEVFEHEGIFYKVSELMTGVTLEDRLARLSDWPLEDCLRVAAMLAHTVSMVHAQGLVHLDLKPANCFLDERSLSNGETRELVRLLDFDAGCVEGAPAPDTVVGTPGFASPEHYGHGPLGPHSDIFSLGLILTLMLAQRYPERPEDARAPWLTPQVSRILQRCLAFAPSERPTAREVYLTLQEPAQPARPLVWLGGPWKARVQGEALSRDGVRGFPGYECLEPRQARVWSEGSNWLISPAEETTNALRLNGVELSPPYCQVLLEGDRVEVGHFAVTVGFE